MERRVILNVKSAISEPEISEIEKNASSIGGVYSAYVIFDAKKLVVSYNDMEINMPALISELKKQGIAAEEELDSRDKELKKLKLSLTLSIIFSLPLLCIMLMLLFPSLNMFINLPYFAWIQFGLASVIQFIFGFDIYKSGFAAFKTRKNNVSSSIAYGSTAAYGYSVFQLFSQTNDLYFFISAIMITVAIWGNYIELKSKTRTSKTVSLLFNLQPKTARVEQENSVKRIKVSQVIVGDITVVSSGEKIPFDGEIIEGSAYVDESMISGEKTVTDKNEGDFVIGGTINRFGTLRIKVSAVGRDTLLYQTIEMVENAKISKTSMSRIGTRFADIFLPLLFLIAIIASVTLFFYTPDITVCILRGVMVIMGGVPCMLGLVIPLGIISGNKNAELKGILIKDGLILENMYKSQNIVLDKTGTITEGTPSVSDVIPVSDFNFEDVVEMLGIAEKHSDNLLGRVIYDYAKARFPKLGTPDTFESFGGMGICATVKGVTLLVGTRRLMYKYDVDTTPFESKITLLEQQGKYAFILSADNQVVAIVGVADAVRSDSKEAIEKLKKQGRNVYMLSGDNEYISKSVAETAGIDADYVIPSSLPEDKVQTIHQLQSRGDMVIMTGDGVNDAPGIAAADIGIVLGTGTEIAMETADVILTGNSLNGVVESLKISKATATTIKTNLGWSLSVQIFSLVFCSMGILTPQLAAAFVTAGGIAIISATAIRHMQIK